MGTPALLVFCHQRGIFPFFATWSIALEGPKTHVLSWPKAPIAAIPATIGISHVTPSLVKKIVNVCMIPEARLISFFGSEISIAKAPKTFNTRTRITAISIAIG